MKAYSANATFLSNIYEQEAGDTNWNEYQVVVTGGSNSLIIRSADTTANTLSIINDVSVSTSNKLLLSTNGSTVVSGTCGTVTSGSIKTQTSTPTIIGSRSSNTSALGALYSADMQYGMKGYKLKPDGKYFWGVKSDGTLLEFSIGTVGNLNTAATTGKSLSKCQGIDFSPDGRYLYRMNTDTNYTLDRLTLGTPWDISTVISSATVTRTLTGLPATSGFSWLRIQPDGLAMLIKFAGNIYRYAIPTAWDTTSMANAYTYTYTIPNSSTYLDCSADGKAWYWTVHNSVNSVSVYAAVSGTAWDPTTMGSAVTLTCTDATYVYSFGASYSMSPLVNLDGTVTLLPLQYSTGYNRHATFNVDIALSKNIDISSFGLGSAPTQAWLNMPTTTIATGKKAGSLYWANTELEVDGNVGGYTGGTATSTTSAVVGLDGTGLLSTGDSVILNGIYTVALTNVTETLNGLVKQDPSNAVDYIKYDNKMFNTGTSTSITDVYQTAYGGQKIRFASNGSVMYIYGGPSSFSGVGVYQYVLSTPWDVTTSTFVTFRSYTTTMTSTPRPSGFDINPDGSSFVIAFGDSFGSFRLQQYTMSTKHDLSTATLTTTMGAGITPAYNGTAAASITNIRFNRTGTEIELYEGWGGSQYHWYYTLGTAYNLSTMNTTNLYTSSYGATLTPQNDGCFSPDGATYFCLGYAGPGTQLDCYLFSQSATTANSFNGFVWTQKSTAANTTYTNWPTGSITNTSYGRSIDISTDGTKMYILLATGAVYQFNVRVKTLTKYALTFGAQTSAPVKIAIPATTTTPTMTPSIVNGNIVQTSNSITTNSRAIQFKLTNNPALSEITKVQLNLKKS